MKGNGDHSSAGTRFGALFTWMLAGSALFASLLYFGGGLIDAVFPSFRSDVLGDDVIVLFGIANYLLSVIYLALTPFLRARSNAEKSFPPLLPLAAIVAFVLMVSLYFVVLLGGPI